MKVLAWTLVLFGCSDDAPLAPKEAGVPDAAASIDAPIDDVLPDSETDAATDAPPDSMLDASLDAMSPSLVVVVACPANAPVVETDAASYAPTQVTISVGEVVRFAPTNPHDVRSGSPAAPTTLFGVDGNDPRCLRFDAAGTFPFYCQVHPTMTGAVLVLAR